MPFFVLSSRQMQGHLSRVMEPEGSGLLLVLGVEDRRPRLNLFLSPTAAGTTIALSPLFSSFKQKDQSRIRTIPSPHIPWGKATHRDSRPSLADPRLRPFFRGVPRLPPPSPHLNDSFRYPRRETNIRIMLSFRPFRQRRKFFFFFLAPPFLLSIRDARLDLLTSLLSTYPYGPLYILDVNLLPSSARRLLSRPMPSRFRLRLRESTFCEHPESISFLSFS